MFKASEKKDISNFNEPYNLSDLNENILQELQDEYKIIFVGEVRCGAKSSLIRRLLGKKFDAQNSPTIAGSCSDLKIKLTKKKEITLHLWDTTGYVNYRASTRMYMTDLDCVVIGYDITDKKSFEEAKGYWYYMVKEVTDCNLIYFIGNKIDLYEQKGGKKEEGIEFAEEENLRFFEISCKTGEGLKEFFDDLVNNLIKQQILN